MSEICRKTASVSIDLDKIIGTRDPKIFGHFLEHFHRQIYGGIYEPGSNLSDKSGFRKDVLAAMKHIQVPVIRWPGGCFVSAYHWMDGVGKRTPYWDKAWRVEESNEFGTDEFIALCREIGTEPYICTNAGTGTAEEMSDWVEYCNLPESGKFAKMRVANGHPEPYNVRYWSIGNENYGDWEIGAKTADDWSMFVKESAKMMLRADWTIELSAASIPSENWDTKLLAKAGSYLKWISIHSYWVQGKPHYDACVAKAQDIEPGIKKVEDKLAEFGLQEKVKIAFDEWNMRYWHHPSALGTGPANVAERDENDDNSYYTMADAVFSARFLNICLRHCNTVGMANFSPIVNTRGAIFTHKNGIVLRSTYHVFDLFTNYTSAEILDADVRTPMFNIDGTEVPYLDIAATYDRESRKLDVVVVNSHGTESIDCEFTLPGINHSDRSTLYVVNGDYADSFNDIDHPDDVCLRNEMVQTPDGKFKLVFEPHSVSVLSIDVQAV